MRASDPVNGHRIEVSKADPRDIDADLFVIGPEAPLVDGLADALRADGRIVFGPGQNGAMLEGSKSFMKRLARKAKVPTADFGVFDELEPAIAFLRKLAGPYVVKTDGLAGGKGVLVTEDFDEAVADVRAKLTGKSFGAAGRLVVIEECLVGPELSLLVLSDGQHAYPLPAAQDFKRLQVDDQGPNTGGMGAYSPVPFAPKGVIDEIMDQLVEPTLSELRRVEIDYRGVLYVGCMLTSHGPKLIEYNVRFGDPEAEVVLARLSGDVAELLYDVAAGQLKREPEVKSDAAVAVVLATRGYPSAPEFGDVITGLEKAGTVEGVTVFHGGTYEQDGEFETSGGRVVTVTGVGPTLLAARERTYRAIESIDFSGMQYRSDIAEMASLQSLEDIEP